MGNIKRLSDSLIPDSYGKIINVSNWRYIKEGPYHNQEGLYIAKDDCRLFFIVGLSTEELHAINYNDLTIEKSVIHLRNILSCPNCAGKGTVDWLQNITKTPPIRKGYNKYWDFVRDKKGSMKEIHSKIDQSLKTKELKTFILSSPLKEKNMYFCTVCHGSGLWLGPAVVIKEFFLEKC